MNVPAKSQNVHTERISKALQIIYVNSFACESCFQVPLYVHHPPQPPPYNVASLTGM